MVKPARQFGLAMQIKSLSQFISLEIDSLYGLQTQKILHLHDQTDIGLTSPLTSNRDDFITDCDYSNVHIFLKQMDQF